MTSSRAACPTPAVIGDLQDAGRAGIAERISYLLSLDHDAPDEETVSLESLHSFAEFLRRNRQLPDPRIGVQSDGLIQIEWFLNSDGIFAMTFLRDGLTRVYAAFDEPDNGNGCMPINGTLTPAETDAAIALYQIRFRRNDSRSEVG